MRLPRRVLLLAALAAPVAAAVEAQTRLPDPPVAEDAPPSAFIAAARTAIAAGRRAEATEALERAESRLLIRSVRPSRAGIPSEQALVRQIAAARAALGQGDRATALDILAGVMASPELDKPEE